jgi:long-chain acyl-CoA synthetase
MLTHKNIVNNAIQVLSIEAVNSTHSFLSILPLSHTYENTLGFILPLMQGATVYYLDKPPTATVLLPALKIVKPTHILSVPMVIEKIYRNQILPKFTNGKIISALYKVGFIRKLLNKLAGKKLYETFGGKLVFFGIGGAPLDPVVEKFLREAKFPYAIGYGLTESAPLLSGANPKQVRFRATGPVLKGVQIKINNPDPVSGEGEIWAKGDNIMKGYYKEPQITSEVLTPDGWLKTGDLGHFDKDNYLYIRGRLKNMILGSSGENIYPEEIESVINNFKYVVESVVVEQKGRLVALVHFNYEELEKQFHEFKDEAIDYINQKIDELTQELQDYVNSRVNKFSRLNAVIAYSTPFEKTATLKIKRYLYY